MGIENIMQRICVQTAVYWGAPEDDGYGGKDFDSVPIEIACRWERRTKVISDAKGEEFVSNTQVIVTQDLEEQGYLFLGDLDDLADLSSSAEDDPETIDGAYSIKKFEKIPSLASTNEFVRKAYL